MDVRLLLLNLRPILALLLFIIPGVCLCTVIMTALAQPLPRQPTRPACLPLQNDTRPEDEV